MGAARAKAQGREEENSVPCSCLFAWQFIVIQPFRVSDVYVDLDGTSASKLRRYPPARVPFDINPTNYSIRGTE